MAAAYPLLDFDFRPLQRVEDPSGYPCFLADRGRYRIGDYVRYWDQKRARIGRLAVTRYTRDVALDLVYIEPVVEHAIQADVVRDADESQFAVSQVASGVSSGQVVHVLTPDGAIQSGVVTFHIFPLTFIRRFIQAAVTTAKEPHS